MNFFELKVQIMKDLKQTGIFKEDVLQAILVEPLFPGSWANDASCSVCAVGATLRQFGLSNDDINIAGSAATAYRYSSDDLYNLNDGVNGLSILSITFERFFENRPVNERTKLEFYQWVDETFPEDQDLLEPLCDWEVTA